jgi:hypothetical protein
VTIRGRPIFEGVVDLYGGFVPFNGGISADNTLNLHSAGLSVRELRSFQRLNFFLPETLAADGTMLNVTGEFRTFPYEGFFGGVVDLTGVTVSVDLEGAGPTMQRGDRFVLIAARELIGDFQPMIGVLGGRPYTVEAQGNDLVLVISSCTEDIVYPGAPLQTVNWVVADSLAPAGSHTGKSCSVSDNRITLNSGSVGSVYGATNSLDSESIYGNAVFIGGGTVDGSVYGGFYNSWKRGTADSNSITISDGTVGDVYGGYAISAAISSASYNSVTVSGGEVRGSIYGGHGFSYGDSLGLKYCSFYNNTVTIRGTPTFGAGTGLYGWYTSSEWCVRSASGYNSFGNNTLNLHSADLSVKDLQNFQSLNFYLPETLAAGGTMLAVNGIVDPPYYFEGGIVDLAGVMVNVGLEGAGPTMRPGDRFVLIAAREMLGDFQPMTGTLGGHSYTVVQEGNSLVLSID